MHDIHGVGGVTSASKVVTAYQDGAGSGTLYSTSTVVGPTTGGSTPGGGAFIAIYGGVNQYFADLYGSFWACGLFLGNPNQGASTSIGIEAPQISNLLLVCTNIGIFQVPGLGTCGLQLTNYTWDGGDAPQNTSVANYSIWLNGDPANVRGYNTMANLNIYPSTSTSDICVYLNNISYATVTNLCIFDDANVNAAGVHLTTTGTSSACKYNVFNGCMFGAGKIVCDSGTADNQFNNTQTAGTVTLNGTGNTQKTTMY
jgi:hypothetical protein